jgi:WD40 repeat protein
LRGWEWRYLWKQCQSEERFILGKHTYGASAVGMLADGKRVFSAGYDKFVRLWDLESRREIGTLPHSAAIIGAAASPDGRWLATASDKGTEGQPVLLWEPGHTKDRRHSHQQIHAAQSLKSRSETQRTFDLQRSQPSATSSCIHELSGTASCPGSQRIRPG